MTCIITITKQFSGSLWHGCRIPGQPQLLEEASPKGEVGSIFFKLWCFSSSEALGCLLAGGTTHLALHQADLRGRKVRPGRGELLLGRGELQSWKELIFSTLIQEHMDHIFWEESQCSLNAEVCSARWNAGNAWEEQVPRALCLFSHLTARSWVFSHPYKLLVETSVELLGHHCCLKQMCISTVIIEIRFSILEILFGQVRSSTAKKQSWWKKPFDFPRLRCGFLGSCWLDLGSGFRLLRQIQKRTFLVEFSKASALFDEICHCRTDLIFFNCWINPKSRLDWKEH